jgi:hypothetical protein
VRTGRCAPLSALRSHTLTKCRLNPPSVSPPHLFTCLRAWRAPLALASVSRWCNNLSLSLHVMPPAPVFSSHFFRSTASLPHGIPALRLLLLHSHAVRSPLVSRFRTSLVPSTIALCCIGSVIPAKFIVSFFVPFSVLVSSSLGRYNRLYRPYLFPAQF